MFGGDKIQVREDRIKKLETELAMTDEDKQLLQKWPTDPIAALM